MDLVKYAYGILDGMDGAESGKLQRCFFLRHNKVSYHTDT